MYYCAAENFLSNHNVINLTPDKICASTLAKMNKTLLMKGMKDSDPRMSDEGRIMLKKSLEKGMREKPESIATIADLAQLSTAINKVEGNEEDLFVITSYNNVLDDFVKKTHIKISKTAKIKDLLKSTKEEAETVLNTGLYILSFSLSLS